MTVTMKHSIAALALSLCLFFSFTYADSCKGCTTSTQCDEGFYCCNNECAPLPSLGEACPCQKCPSGLGCKNGTCVYNGPNCTCNTASDCTFSPGSGYSVVCVANKCELVSSTPPFSYFTPGGPCDSSCVTKYCNATTNLCDYNPLGTACSYSFYCVPGSGCFDGICQPLKSLGEECNYQGQCLDYVCRQSSSSSASTCMKKGEAGEYCADQSQCNNMDCINNACTYPARGEPCFQGNCSPADVCHVNYTCIAPNSLPNGESCNFGTARACQSSICSGSVCLPMSSLGGACNVTAQCPNGQCLNNKCYGIAFSGEKCNSTYACFNSARPCQNGVCPQFYSAIGEVCTSNAECAVGFCSNGVCDYPTTCNVTSDCGRNLVCDCGECKFMPDNEMTASRYYLYYTYYAIGPAQLLARSPERDCINNMVVNSQCESVIAKYYCYLYCFSTGAFPNEVTATVNVDCATLKVLALNVTKQPCCSATSQTDCADSIANCRVFNENNIKPFITRPIIPAAPTSAPTSTAPVSTPSSSAPQSTPSASAPQSAPTSSAPQAAPTTVPQAPSVPSAAPVGSAPTAPSTAPLATPSSSATCNCAAPTPLCDQELSACVGLRVTPIVQCVEYANNQYTAYMTYVNDQSTNVTLSDEINFLNVNVQNKVALFITGRPFTYPQSAFNVITATAQQVSWYLDGFKLTFDIATEELRCPQDVTFQMTSSATVEQLLAISDSLIGNLSDVMQIARARLNVTFSASTKRQSTSSVITVVVKADQTSADSSSQVVLDFVQTGFTTFTSRVPTAAVASVTTVPPANEQSGSKAVTPPATNNPIALNAPRDRGVVSSATRVFVNIAMMMGLVSFLF